MGKGIEQLSALTISRKLKRGYYADGGGLYLQVTNSGSKSWVFRFRSRAGHPGGGRLREMGLGAFHAVTLAEARDTARACRKQLQDGIDPINERKRSFVQAVALAAASMTFSQCAEAYIKAHRPSWRHEKHAQQWTNTLTTYVEPVLGNLPVRDIDTRRVMKVIEPIWNDKRETASRIRGRIEVILDWAAVYGYRDIDNPARWKGKIDKLLPSRSRTTIVQHHPALPYIEIPAFMASLRQQKGCGGRTGIHNPDSGTHGGGAGSPLVGN